MSSFNESKPRYIVLSDPGALRPFGVLVVKNYDPNFNMTLDGVMDSLYPMNENDERNPVKNVHRIAGMLQTLNYKVEVADFDFYQVKRKY